MRLLENGIKPLYVFDGHAPKLKKPVLEERREKREEAKKEFDKAEKKGDTLKMEILRPQTAQVTKTVKKNCKELLKLLGIPYFNAPGEAEAQCAAFVESGIVYATATMDLDALTFGTKVVLRNFPFTKQVTNKNPVTEIHLEKVLGTLGLTLDEFIELSIIMGCDYCKGIEGLGSHKAIELIKRYKTIENILGNTDYTADLPQSHSRKFIETE
ncbi:flap endonuclease 1-like [Macrosteles quadrilineatus]|uniref:flap endonuclease 1-like n=1 Tax=Macrosteles quadrilineatus TaxID=74068 RepID=UPI0023E22CC3|nr:flap endonuclease 1-like [Macrosteles quadrilineatus]